VVQQRLPNFLERGREHPVGDGNHAYPAAWLIKGSVALNEAGIQVGLSLLEVENHESLEPRGEVISAHIGWVCNHGIVPLRQQTSLLKQRPENMSRGVRQIAILQHVVEPPLDLWQLRRQLGWNLNQ